MEIGGKWNYLGPGVEHDSANPAFTGFFGQVLEASKVAAMQRGAGFHFDAHEAARCVFQHNVNFLP